MRYLPIIIGFVVVSATAGCRPSAEDVLGRAPAFVVLEREKQGSDVVRRSRGVDGAAAEVTAAVTEGFAAELMRTVFVTQQYVGNATIDGNRASKHAQSWAAEAVAMVMGGPDVITPQRGLKVSGGWLGGPVERPDAVWIGVPDRLEDARATTAELTARLARYLGEAAATAGTFTGGGKLAEAYQAAMSVIGREWRTAGAMRGAAPPKNDQASAATFAGIRENRFVFNAQRELRPAAELLDDPLVAATVMYRLSQDKKLSKTVAPDAFYAPLVNDRVPPGVSPAAVLGVFRNMQMKLLGSWIAAVLKGQPPSHIGDLVEVYGQAFPAEKEDVLRIFLVTTMGGTVVSGGVAQTGGPEGALNHLNQLLADVIAGKRTLTSATSPQ